MLRPLFVLLAAGLVAVQPACDRLKKKPAPAAPAAIPEIVREPAAEPAVPVAPAEQIDPATPALTINKSATVSVLGYHEFVTGRAGADMECSVERFREHMQALKDARIPVIALPDFLAWRRGEKDIPDAAVLITMDDGWKSVYQLAFPILKEYGYPFTLFLYKNFINIGKSLTTAEIKEMMAAGATVGSHSVSHPYRPAIAAIFKRSAEEGEAFLRREMKDSRQYLEDLLAVKVTAYAYPGGFYSEREETIGKEAGYEALFTVNPAKVTWDTPFTALGRYIIHGRDPKDGNFKRAISTRGSSGGDLVRQLLGGEDEGGAAVTTSPAPNATIAARHPLIEVDVSKLEGIDPATVEVKIAGFGRVPATFDTETRKIRHQVRETLRTGECQVYVTFRRSGEPKPDQVSWRFFVDKPAHYLPAQPAPKPEVIAEPEAEPPGR